MNNSILRAIAGYLRNAPEVVRMLEICNAVTLGGLDSSRIDQEGSADRNCGSNGGLILDFFF